MKRRTVVLGLTVAAIGSMGAVGWLRQSNHQIHQASSFAADSWQASSSDAPAETKPGGWTPVAPAQEEGPREPAQKAETFEERIARGVSAKYRPLLPDAERERVHEVLSDPALLESAADDLLRVDSALSHRDDQERRRKLVVFFENALAWKENPQAKEVVARVRKVILTENYQSYAGDLWQQRSLAGDKVELIWALAAHRPEAVEALTRDASQGKNAKLVAYAFNRLGNRRTE